MTVRINGNLTEEEAAGLEAQTPDSVRFPWRVEVSTATHNVTWREVAVCQNAREGVECLEWHRANVKPEFFGQKVRLVHLASDY